MSKVRMVFHGDTGKPAFTVGQLNRIREVHDWMALCHRVSPSDGTDYSEAEAALAVVLTHFDGEDDDGA